MTSKFNLGNFYICDNHISCGTITSYEEIHGNVCKFPTSKEEANGVCSYEFGFQFSIKSIDEDKLNNPELYKKASKEEVIEYMKTHFDKMIKEIEEKW